MISRVVRVQGIFCFHKFSTEYTVMALGGEMDGLEVVSGGRSVQAVFAALAALVASVSFLNEIV